MPNITIWRCEACRRELGTVDDGRLRVGNGLRVEVDRRGTILVSCPLCGHERAWKTRRAA